MTGFEYGMMGYMGLLVFLFFLLIKIAVLVAAIWLVVVLIKWMRRPLTKPKAESADKSLQILRERFARGEISEEEYQTMKKILDDSNRE
ncbi:hypothetical protein EWH99_03105 [Sporolactobacillus sp. THM7-7]|nr:hypothetical protein EWH99_03105 [Sporolactobacillus sp. THM7-7]